MRITGNPVIDCAVAAWLLAQVAKALLELLLERRLHPARLVSSGGMPSSHSACVMGCTTAVGRFSGLTSPLFGV